MDIVPDDIIEAFDEQDIIEEDSILHTYEHIYDDEGLDIDPELERDNLNFE